MGLARYRDKYLSKIQWVMGRVLPVLSKNVFARFLQNLPSEDESLISLSQKRGIERRSAIRVIYPVSGHLAHLPVVEINGKDFRARDISLGGVCLYDPKLKMGTQIGGSFKILFKFEWGNLEASATIMGITLDHCHVKMTDFTPNFKDSLEKILVPGYLGQKFFRVGGFDAIHRSEVREIWVTTTGDNFVVYKENQENEMLAEFTSFGVTTQIYEKSPPRIKYPNGRFEEENTVKISVVNDQIVCLANFRSPSEHVKYIMALLQYCVEPEHQAS